MNNTGTAEVSRERLKPTWRAYLELCKPRVVLLMLITAIVGMFLAAPGMVDGRILIFGTLGIALGAGSAAAVNHLVDQRIDALMGRTEKRPLPTGQLSPVKASIFAFCLALLSMAILVIFVNRLTAILTLLTLMGYAGIYSICLKHTTPQNIVIGGISGAAPPLLGWTAVTGTLDPYSLLLVLIIFIWTPPHFWALAIHRFDDYKKAGVPMLPVTHGIEFTKLCIFLYTLLLLVVSVLPYVMGMSGILYFGAALVLGGIFVYQAWRLKIGEGKQHAMATFWYSIIYLFVLFIFLLIDHYVRVL